MFNKTDVKINKMSINNNVDTGKKLLISHLHQHHFQLQVREEIKYDIIVGIYNIL